MNAQHLVNYQVLQNAFKAHKIDKPILVEKLTIYKMQDNLEFLQWLKNFYEQNYECDPVARGKETQREHLRLSQLHRAYLFCRYRARPVSVCDVRIRRAQTRSISPRCTRCLDGLEKQHTRLVLSDVHDIEILARHASRAGSTRGFSP